MFVTLLIRVPPPAGLKLGLYLRTSSFHDYFLDLTPTKVLKPGFLFIFLLLFHTTPSIPNYMIFWHFNYVCRQTMYI